jgi:imidazole glycerol-phosphate synthase subunit HisF
MKKKRLIPLLLMQNGFIVKSKRFSRHQRQGNPVTAVKRLSEWASDELIYLDITQKGSYDLNRDDLAFRNSTNILDIIKDTSSMTLMPITVGGGIRTLKDIEKRLEVGADKISVNSICIQNPKFIAEAAREFGSQCVVVSIDYVSVDGELKVYDHKEKSFIDKNLIEWVKQVASEGAGEILINSVERDGMQTGYDLPVLDEISRILSIPIIACGGVGEWEHLLEVLQSTHVDAAAAANIFHFSDQSVYLAKKYLYEQGASVRYPELLKI